MAQMARQRCRGFDILQQNRRGPSRSQERRRRHSSKQQRTTDSCLKVKPPGDCRHHKKSGLGRLGSRIVLVRTFDLLPPPVPPHVITMAAAGELPCSFQSERAHVECLGGCESAALGQFRPSRVQAQRQPPRSSSVQTRTNKTLKRS